MRAHEIIQDYVDPQKVPHAMYHEIVNALERIGATPASSEFIQLMYCDHREELELEQLRMDLTQTRAEVKGLDAEAALARAETCRELSAVEGKENE